MVMYKIPSAVTVIASVLLFWGWHVSTTDGIEFARSGALVTALSLAFMFWHYGQILADRERLVAKEVKEAIAAMNIRPEHTQDAGRTLEEHIHTHRNRTERYITRWQAAIVAIGTLVWGFGDLIFQYRNLPIPELFWRFIYLGGKIPSPILH